MSNIVLKDYTGTDHIVTFANDTLSQKEHDVSKRNDYLNDLAEKFYQWANKLDAKRKYSFAHGLPVTTEPMRNEFLHTLNLTFTQWLELTREYDDGQADIADMTDYVQMRLGIKKKKRVVKKDEDEE